MIEKVEVFADGREALFKKTNGEEGRVMLMPDPNLLEKMKLANVDISKIDAVGWKSIEVETEEELTKLGVLFIMFGALSLQAKALWDELLSYKDSGVRIDKEPGKDTTFGQVAGVDEAK